MPLQTRQKRVSRAIIGQQHPPLPPPPPPPAPSLNTTISLRRLTLDADFVSFLMGFVPPAADKAYNGQLGLLREYVGQSTTSVSHSQHSPDATYSGSIIPWTPLHSTRRYNNELGEAEVGENEEDDDEGENEHDPGEDYSPEDDDHDDNDHGHDHEDHDDDHDHENHNHDHGDHDDHDYDNEYLPGAHAGAPGAQAGAAGVPPVGGGDDNCHRNGKALKPSELAKERVQVSNADIEDAQMRETDLYYLSLGSRAIPSSTTPGVQEPPNEPPMSLINSLPPDPFSTPTRPPGSKTVHLPVTPPETPVSRTTASKSGVVMANITNLPLRFPPASEPTTTAPSVIPTPSNPTDTSASSPPTRSNMSTRSRTAATSTSTTNKGGSHTFSAPTKASRAAGRKASSWTRQSKPAGAKPKVAGDIVTTRTIQVFALLERKCQALELSDIEQIVRYLNGQSFASAVDSGDTSLAAANVHLKVQALTQRCMASEKLEIVAQFVSMVNHIQLRAAVECYCRLVGCDSLSRAYDDMISKGHDMPCKKNAFTRHCWMGSLWTRLAAAGTIYFLLLIAACQMKAKLSTEILDNQVQKFCDALSKPKASKSVSLAIKLDGLNCIQADELGKMVIETIIPWVADIRQNYAFSVRTLFMNDLLRSLNLPSTIVSSDLPTCDRFFFQIQMNLFKCDRDEDAWASCLVNSNPPNEVNMDSAIHSYLGEGSVLGKRRQESPPEGQPLHKQKRCHGPGQEGGGLPMESNLDLLAKLSSTDVPNVETVYTDFDFSATENKGRRIGSQAERLKLTEKCREEASRAYVPKNLDDFKTKLREQLKAGFRQDTSKYILMDPDVIGDNIRITDTLEESLAMVFKRVPLAIRKDLINSLNKVFPGILRYLDTSKESHPQFKTVHMTEYNRYSPRGNDAPDDIDPREMERDGNPLPHISQLLPRQSVEMQNFEEQYILLQELFKPLFEWVRDQVYEYFPEEAKTLEMFVDLLPGDAISPVHPFGGLVINFNVASSYHRDPMDEKICFVLCISDCVGGELVLVEPGVVIKLRCGDSVVFRSTQISHLNLHYVGLRSSFVMSTDRHGQEWVKSCNGWENNRYFGDSRRERMSGIVGV
ncbi:hypothetical protein V5O48_015353 [Marasmius crinis-equi]|uniref:Uncharacterized protein n=1 Tax=Marasmius crinis-equi TaxID=585013 RepID=A0ABR3EV40_9AGAR